MPSGGSGSTGILAKIEGADLPGLTGQCITAALGITEDADAIAAAGSFLTTALAAVTAGNDSPVLTGLLTAVGTAAVTAGNDAPSIAGMLTSYGSFAVTGGSDSFSGVALSTDAGSFAVTGGADAAAMLGSFLAAGSAAITASNDSAVFTAICGELGTIGPTDDHDSSTLAGVFTAPAVMAVTEGRDTSGSTPGLTVSASMGATEGHDTFTVFSSGLEYQIYSNTGIGDPINYGLPISTTGLLTWTSGPLTYPGTWKFGVRAFNPVTGLEEENLDAAVTIILDASGIDITNRPKAPIALRAFPTAGGGIRVEWAYNTINPNPVPTGFHVYKGTGGSPSYGSIVATVSFSAAIAGTFVANLAGLSNGIAYTIGVRAYNATAEEPNTAAVTVTADTTGPSSVVSLTATAII